MQQYSVSAWFVVALCAILPPTAALASAGPGRERFGKCIHCGCDLRAIPGACPECGATPTP